MSGGGETVRISLGPTASAVSAHLCNLEGLACTSPSAHPDGGGGGPLCDPNVTHAAAAGLHVPRVLFVDGSDSFDSSPWQRADGAEAAEAAAAALQGQQQQGQQGQQQGQAMAMAMAIAAPGRPSQPGNGYGADPLSGGVPTWPGRVEVHRQLGFGSNFGKDRAQDRAQDGAAASAPDPLASFRRAALAMSSAPRSRYRTGSSSHSSRFAYGPTSTSMSEVSERHMVWDEDEDEDDGYGYGNEEERDEMRRSQERRDAARWHGDEQDAYHRLSEAWRMHHGHGHGHAGAGEGPAEAGGGEGAEGDPRPQRDQEEREEREEGAPHGKLSWMDYFMPPHPAASTYAAPLPFGTSGSGYEGADGATGAYVSSYFAGHSPSSAATALASGTTLSSSWREDVLAEKVRKILEDCDAVRGFNVTVEGGGSLHAGLATGLLQDLKDECRSAGRFCISVNRAADLDRGALRGGQFGRGAVMGSGPGADGASESRAVGTFRSALNSGLALHGLTENSDVFLPISLPQCGRALSNGIDTSVFSSSAAAALAIEASSLPYRLLGPVPSSEPGGPRKSKIGIQSGYFAGSAQSSSGSDPYANADKLSFHEFLSCLRPSNRHTVLELDAMIRPTADVPLDQALLQGTSIERRRLEADANRNRGRYRYGGRSQDVEPGLWLEDHGNFGGTLSSLSPAGGGMQSLRSNHTHFALSTAYRPAGTDPSRDPAAAYTTLIMEGMGIRYRPEVSVGSVVRQSIRGLTDNAGYGAGAYWDSVLGRTKDGSNTFANTPVLAVLGNSTRIHGHLVATSSNLEAALSRKYTGYMERDTMAGLTPEGDDCTEAAEACYELRDTYEPPTGSGLIDNNEGAYFSDNDD